MSASSKSSNESEHYMDIVTQKWRKNLIQLNKTGTIGEKEYARQHEQFGIVTPNLLNRLRNNTEMKENRNLFNDLGQNKREELKAKKKQLQKEMKQTAKMQAPRIIYVKTQKSCQLCKDKFVSSNFAPEMNASYFGPSGDMAGEECNACKVEPTDEGTKKLTNSKPWFCCSGREKHGCKTCYCNSCYQDKLLKNDDGNKRTSRKRGTTS